MQPPVKVTLDSPDSGIFKRGDTVLIKWTAANASSGDKMTVSMKRDSYSSLTSPDGVNFIRFTESELNDGSYPAVIPNTAACDSDWRFYVKHNTADKWDSSDSLITVQQVVTVILNSPNSGTFKRGDTVYVTWSADRSIFN